MSFANWVYSGGGKNYSWDDNCRVPTFFVFRQTTARVRHDVKKALQSLPQPRNDYEIVPPENDVDMDTIDAESDWVPDASDIDQHRKDRIQAQRMQIFI